MMEKFESQKKILHAKKMQNIIYYIFYCFIKIAKKKRKKKPQKILTSFVRDKYLIDTT